MVGRDSPVLRLPARPRLAIHASAVRPASRVDARRPAPHGLERQRGVLMTTPRLQLGLALVQIAQRRAQAEQARTPPSETELARRHQLARVEKALSLLREDGR